jgi:predicted TIM-barrel fold metal-dependent hydrolase
MDTMDTTNSRLTVIDAAQYVIEPPDLFTANVPSALRDRVPRVVEVDGAGDAWSFEDGAWLRPVGLEAQAGRGPLDLSDQPIAYRDLRLGLLEAESRLSDMDADEIDAAVLFPTFAQDLRFLSDAEVQTTCVRVYNDGLADWVQRGRGRLVAPALVPTTGLDDALTEVQRAAAKGFAGVIFTGWPAGGDRPQPAEDRFWALCAEAGLPVHLIAGGPLASDRVPSAPARYVGPNSRARAVDLPIEILWTQQATSKNVNLSWLVLSGVLDRFPDLQLVLVDSAAGWLPTCGELLDWNYRYAQFLAFARLRLRPSDYIKRQVRATIRSERNAIASRRDVGVATMMWSSGYPQSTSSRPNSARSRDELFGSLPIAERAALQGGNAASLYRIESVHQLATTASQPR